eukprot:1340996-Rhodomonas_salina.1
MLTGRTRRVPSQLEVALPLAGAASGGSPSCGSGPGASGRRPEPSTIKRLGIAPWPVTVPVGQTWSLRARRRIIKADVSFQVSSGPGPDSGVTVTEDSGVTVTEEKALAVILTFLLS